MILPTEAAFHVSKDTPQRQHGPLSALRCCSSNRTAERTRRILQRGKLQGTVHLEHGHFARVLEDVKDEQLHFDAVGLGWHDGRAVVVDGGDLLVRNVVEQVAFVFRSYATQEGYGKVMVSNVARVEEQVAVGSSARCRLWGDFTILDHLSRVFQH